MKSFKRKQVVWAKTKGRISLNYYQIRGGQQQQVYNKLPKITKCLESNEYAIDFIGDDSPQSANLPLDNIVDFQEKCDEFSGKAKAKKLKDAIASALELLGKQPTPHLSDSEEEGKPKRKKAEGSKAPVTRIMRKNKKSQDIEVQCVSNFKSSPEKNDDKMQIQQKRNWLDREFQDLLPLLIASSLNYDQIRLKLTPILDTIEGQVKKDISITDILLEKKGQILNAVYMILKHQSEQNPDHFFTKDIQQQIQRLQELISSLKQALLSQFFDPQTIINHLQECCSLGKSQRMLQDVISKQFQPVKEMPEKETKKRIPPPEQKKEKSEDKKKKLVKSQSTPNPNPLSSPVQVVPPISNSTPSIELPKKPNRKQEIVDQHLRRKVCFNMLKLVQEYTIEEEPAKQIVTKIECFGRENDPTMKLKYGKLMWSTLNNLQANVLRRDELLGILQENDWTEVWSKLIQPVDRNRRLRTV